MEASISALSKMDLYSWFKTRGIRPTKQRIEMAYVLHKQKQHLSAEGIGDLINEEMPKASRATIFNNVKLFVQVGLLKELQVNGGTSIYDSNVEKHHHKIDKYGNISDIILTDSENDQIEAMLKNHLDEEIQDIQLIVRYK